MVRVRGWVMCMKVLAKITQVQECARVFECVYVCVCVYSCMKERAKSRKTDKVRVCSGWQAVQQFCGPAEHQ